MLIVNEIIERIISILILNNDTLPVLGLNLGYMVKYSPPPLGVPSGGGLYLTYIPCLVLIRIQSLPHRLNVQTKIGHHYALIIEILFNYLNNSISC